MQYPLVWNSHQNWNLSFTGTKATLHLIYEHRYFFQGKLCLFEGNTVQRLMTLFCNSDLINDWSSRNPADLLYHVPYTWFLKFCLKEFELVTVANQFNWVDCSSQRQENGKNFIIIVIENTWIKLTSKLFTKTFHSLRSLQWRLSRALFCSSVYRFSSADNGTQVPNPGKYSIAQCTVDVHLSIFHYKLCWILYDSRANH